MELQNKPPEYWRVVLTDNQFSILREGGTEPKFSSRYIDTQVEGKYICAGCEQAGQENPLFSSEKKFDSGGGWPSFYQAIDDAVKSRRDKDGKRIEALCGNCDGHLGHVFDDGPAPTYKRYCINSAALYLRRKDGAIEENEPIP